MKNLFKRLLTHPAFILVVAIGGACSGIYYPNFGKICEPWGKLYLTLLQMSVVPILFTAVVSSLGKLVSQHGITRKLSKIFLVFFIGLFASSLIGVLTGVIFAPGANLSSQARDTIGTLMSQEASGQFLGSISFGEQVYTFVKQLIPDNPMAAIAEGKTLSILFFSILFGLALGLGSPESRFSALGTIEAFFQAMLKIVHWTLYGLPFGMFLIFASTFSSIGVPILTALAKFVVTTLVMFFVVACVHVIYLKKISKLKWKPLFRALQNVIFVSLGTRSSFAAIPASMEFLEKHLKHNSKTVGLVIPLGVSLNPQGNALLFSLITLFAAQIYGNALTPIQLGMVWIGSMFAAMAAAGAPGPIVFSLISIVCRPIGVPTELIMVLMIAVDSIIDPPLTLVNVLSNCSTGSFLSQLDHVPDPQVETSAVAIPIQPPAALTAELVLAEPGLMDERVG